MNSTLISAGLFLVALAVAGAAYGLRYAPVQGGGLDMVTVWDRWEQRVCVVSLPLGNRVICDVAGLRQPKQ